MEGIHQSEQTLPNARMTRLHAFADLFSAGLKEQGVDKELTREQISKLIDRLGFGSFGEDLFDRFVPSGAQVVSARVLLTAIQQSTHALRPLILSWANAGLRTGSSSKLTPLSSRHKLRQISGSTKNLLANDAEHKDVRSLLARLRNWLRVDGSRSEELFKVRSPGLRPESSSEVATPLT